MRHAITKKPLSLPLTLCALTAITLSIFVLMKAVHAVDISWTSGNPIVRSVADAGTQDKWYDFCRAKFQAYKQQVKLFVDDPNLDIKTDCYLGNHSGVNI